MRLKFIADIHISPKTVDALRKEGFDINRVTDFLSASATDEEIIDEAIDKKVIIITQDLGFPYLAIREKAAKPSIITLRLGSPTPQKITQLLLKTLPEVEKELKKGSIIVIDENKIRIRKLF